MPYSIRAGVRIEENKNAANMGFEEIPEPSIAVFYVQNTALKEGDTVKKWQKIGENGDMPVYASLSGRVVRISQGEVTVENDFTSQCENVLPVQKLIKDLSGDEIREIIKNAAVYSYGKPAFKMIGSVKKVIINLLESEPYLCSMYRLTMDDINEIIGGAKIFMKACGVRRAVIAIESGKRDAMRVIRNKIGISKLFEIKVFKSKYPQDDPRQIIYAIDGVEIDTDKELADEGYAVFDGFSCVDAYRALAQGVPAVTRYITVDGDCIANPKNLCVPVGTPIGHIAEYCGLSGDLYKLIEGGPMRGKTLYSLENALSAGANGLIFMSHRFEKPRTTECINCGRCGKHCPMYLMPNLIVQNKATGAQSCISCGVCSYVCPANIPLTQKISQIAEK